MSQRSIIEINHDLAGAAISRDPEAFVKWLTGAIASGSDRMWEPLERYGIKRITQCHHSEDRLVVVGAGGLKREYPFG